MLRLIPFTTGKFVHLNVALLVEILHHFGSDRVSDVLAKVVLEDVARSGCQGFDVLSWNNEVNCVD